VEPRARVELATCRLRIGCSTTELPRLFWLQTTYFCTANLRLNWRLISDNCQPIFDLLQCFSHFGIRRSDVNVHRRSDVRVPQNRLINPQFDSTATEIRRQRSPKSVPALPNHWLLKLFGVIRARWNYNPTRQVRQIQRSSPLLTGKDILLGLSIHFDRVLVQESLQEGQNRDVGFARRRLCLVDYRCAKPTCRHAGSCGRNPSNAVPVALTDAGP
jgi:hypothetical protein